MLAVDEEHRVERPDVRQHGTAEHPDDHGECRKHLLFDLVVFAVLVHAHHPELFDVFVTAPR